MISALKNPRKLFITFLIVILMQNIFIPSQISAFEKVFRNSSGMEFVFIPAGAFIMGSPSDEPSRHKSEIQHKVVISKPFYLQTTEVTLKQWRDLMGKRLLDSRKGTGNMPVVKVSWNDCIRFIEKLNANSQWLYRLPTEAEWEYACRAGSTTAYSWGNTIDCAKAMYSNNSKRSGECLDYIKSRVLAVNQPAPVKSYPPNPWGLYDMHGNVWEWCQDLYGAYSTGPVTDPLGHNSGTKRIRRGGSWFKHEHSCRSANRAYGHPATRFQTTGFRLVREIR